jgi:hypothetical protein
MPLRRAPYQPAPVALLKFDWIAPAALFAESAAVDSAAA